jgi:hypothetical protein
VGKGDVTGVNFTFLSTFDRKVYGLSGTSVYFSSIDLPSIWNDPNSLGNGFAALTDYCGSPESLVAIAPYQGRLVFLSRRTSQIWVIDADPGNWDLQQTLQGIGTTAALSVQPLGDLDVLLLSDSGIRSLRVRDSSLNAFVNDLGSPIDELVQASIRATSFAIVAAACGIVEPTSNRYWCYLNGVIYVLSYFPSNKIVAWTTYTPSYEKLLQPASIVFDGSKHITYSGLVVGHSYIWTP